MTAQKQCCACKRWKNIECFRSRKRKTRKGVLKVYMWTRCIECQNAYQRDWKREARRRPGMLERYRAASRRAYAKLSPAERDARRIRLRRNSIKRALLKIRKAQGSHRETRYTEGNSST